VILFILAGLACLVGAWWLGATCPSEPEAYGMYVLDFAAAVCVGSGVAATRRSSRARSAWAGFSAALITLALAVFGHVAIFGMFCAR
jgi:hypothetical protein